MSRQRRKEERNSAYFINDKAVKKDSSAEKIRTPEVFEVRKPVLSHRNKVVPRNGRSSRVNEKRVEGLSSYSQNFIGLGKDGDQPTAPHSDSDSSANVDELRHCHASVAHFKACAIVG
ncbi:hypothetical protein B0H14DRAFT_2560958 [Mycena olivaceomarginata]|nr:hypothetical protein B0H14DRAFT_2560958 [Mycena olivaceomarginata]